MQFSKLDTGTELPSNSFQVDLFRALYPEILQNFLWQSETATHD
jgi:hypothetical protein